MQMRDLLGTFFTDDQFSDLYLADGQLAYAPWRLALVSVIQFTEELTDRETADAIHSPITASIAGYKHLFLLRMRIKSANLTPFGGKNRLCKGPLAKLIRPPGVRDAAILWLLYSCGLIREALVALEVTDVELKTAKLLIRVSEVQGAHNLCTWRCPASAPRLAGGCWNNIRCTAHTDQQVWQADTAPYERTEHLRRAQAAGSRCSSVDTTRRCDRHSKETKRKSARNLHFPY